MHGGAKGTEESLVKTLLRADNHKLKKVRFVVHVTDIDVKASLS